MSAQQPMAGPPENDSPQDDAPRAAARRAPGHNHPLVHRAAQIGRAALVLAVVAAIAYAMVAEWDGIAQTFRRLRAIEIGAAVLCVVLGLVCSAKSWQQQLVAMGTTVKFTGAAEAHLVGQLGKYLGGGALAVLLQAQLGKRFKIPRARGLVALMTAVGTSVVAALTLAVLIVPRLAEQYGEWLWILAAGPLALVAMYPPLLTRLANLALTGVRRSPLARTMPAGPVTASLCWAFASWVAFGLHLWLVSGAIVNQSLAGFLSCVAAMALAMSAGSIAFILPGGLGVREAILVAALAPVASVKQSLVIALASRILFSFGELAGAGSAAFASWLSLRRRGQVENVTEAE